MHSADHTQLILDSLDSLDTLAQPPRPEARNTGPSVQSNSPLVAFPYRQVPPALLGGKAATLELLGAARFPVPPWFVVTPAALQASLTPQQRRAWASARSSAEIQPLLAALTLAPEVQAQIVAALAALSPQGHPVAVRSSARSEDGRHHSFAGQLASYLNVAPADVLTRVVDVWRSGFSPQVYAYRSQHGLSLQPETPAVLIQAMIQPTAAGVAFSADPVSGRRRQALVAAGHGLAQDLVAGLQDADHYTVSQHDAVAHQNLLNPSAPILTDAQAQLIAGLARRAAQTLGRPQDIEWALVEDQVYLLQSRPITTLEQLPDPDGSYALWDNSNIVESYGGITTPLTYSFARRAYAQVYIQFCRILGVPEATIQGHSTLFASMIGLIQGRIYYNLTNWYRLLALLPGFQLNHRFMEQMMGVRDGLPPSVMADIRSQRAQSSRRGWTPWVRVQESLSLLGSGTRLVLRHLRCPQDIADFHRRLDQVLERQQPDLSLLSTDELVTYYQYLESHLLDHWDTPLVNDFLAMIFYGLLRKLTVAWCDDEAGTLQNGLLAGEGGLISAEPAQRVRKLAETAAQDPAFVELLCTGSAAAVHTAMASQPDFRRQYQSYLEKFADRCQDELKLESPTLREDDRPLLRAVGQLARHGLTAHAAAEDPAVGSSRQQTIRTAAEAEVAQALADAPQRRILFAWVLSQARARVRDRENLRFERTRVFGRARQIFQELGRRLCASGALANPVDIFYLEVGEILGYVTGTATTTDLAALVGVRQEEYRRYSQLPAPAARFATYGPIYQGNDFRAPQQAAAVSGPSLQGTGCCTGIVRGRARLVRDPSQAQLEAGDILVAERTDPSWIMILPAAAGLLVERGSLLSHAAIVARELGLPAIVGLQGLTSWISDGEPIEFDGRTGLVRRIEA